MPAKKKNHSKTVKASANSATTADEFEVRFFLRVARDRRVTPPRCARVRVKDNQPPTTWSLNSL